MVRTSHVHFSTGFRCEEHDNPADYFLDVITHCESQSVTVIENTGGLVEGILPTSTTIRVTLSDNGFVKWQLCDIGIWSVVKYVFLLWDSFPGNELPRPWFMEYNYVHASF